jgi:hypothetical protein
MSGAPAATSDRSNGGKHVWPRRISERIFRLEPTDLGDRKPRQMPVNGLFFHVGKMSRALLEKSLLRRWGLPTSNISVCNSVFGWSNAV